MKTSTITSILVLCFAALGSSAAAQSSQTTPSVTHDASFGVARPTARIAPHVSRDVIWVMPASMEKIFPLLCPVLEYDWIPSWRTQLIHSKSGVAEENCIFETRSPSSGPMIWICTRYEPPTYIEYTCFAQHGFIFRLQITLKNQPEGTQMLWRRSWYACNPEGEAWVKQWNSDGDAKTMNRRKAEMEHYLRTGTLLQPAGT